MKVLIVLDIDGTITNCHYSTPPGVIEYLTKLQGKGFVFAFVTGRTFVRGFQSLRQLSFPYYFSVQNGALLLQMPEQRVLKRKYLDSSVIPIMDEICHSEGSDYVIYSGYEDNDITYYRKGYFPAEELDFLLQRSIALKEDWRPIETFENFEGPIVSLKYIGPMDTASRIAKKIEEKLDLHVPLIADPFDAKHCIVQATDPAASKGLSLRDLKELDPKIDLVIAAGDDTNDLSMLQEADIKVAMRSSPKSLLEIADIIAPSVEDEGIVQGLNRAIAMLDGKQGADS